MKNKFWLLGIIALAVVIGFVISCGGEKIDPTVNWPVDLTAEYGKTLAEITLPDNGSGTAGIFTWTTSNLSVGNVGIQSHSVTFTPTDIAAFNVKTQDVQIRVCPQGMVWIPAGSFTMGSPADEPGRLVRENPRTENNGLVTLNGFYMAKFPVTQSQYITVMNVVNPSYFNTNTALPVEQVSWYDAVEFCNRLSIIENLSPAYSLDGKTNPDEWGTKGSAWDAIEIVAGSNGYRLPTEAQWEYACRAGTTAAFNWGNNVINDTLANYYASVVDANNLVAGTNRMTTTVQGTFAPNSWGLYDMHGNVFEWCWDWYAASYDNAGGSDNPTGAVSGAYRVRRGGSWSIFGQFLRSAYRGFTDPSFRDYDLGFRLLRP